MVEPAPILVLGLDGVWPALDLARLLHLLVRGHRFEAFLAAAGRERPDLLERPFDAITLKYLAAFDWIAAPLMSPAYNESYARSEEFVAGLGLADPVLVGLTLGPPGELVLGGSPGPIGWLRDLLAAVLSFGEAAAAPENASQGRLGAIEALYGDNLRARRPLLAATGYGEAELHALLAPSLEDLQFVSNAAAQGRITRVETRARAG